MMNKIRKKLTASQIGVIIVGEHIGNVVDHLIGIIVQVDNSALILNDWLPLAHKLRHSAAHHWALWTAGPGSGSHAAQLWRGNVHRLEHWRPAHLQAIVRAAHLGLWLPAEDAHWTAAIVWGRTIVWRGWLTDLWLKMRARGQDGGRTVQETVAVD